MQNQNCSKARLKRSSTVCDIRSMTPDLFFTCFNTIQTLLHRIAVQNTVQMIKVLQSSINDSSNEIRQRQECLNELSLKVKPFITHLGLHITTMYLWV